MIFLKPFFLFFLPLSLIPIIIHLLLPYKKRKIFYPWIDLFKKEKEIKKKRRIRDLIVLLMRILTILFVILSFSKPRIKSRFGVFNHILYFEHPYWKRKVKMFDVKKIPASKFDSVVSDINTKDIYILGPVPDTFAKKIYDIKDKRIYIIGTGEVKNLKIKDIKKIEDRIFIDINSDFDTSSVSLEIYYRKNLILRKDVDIKKGNNIFTFSYNPDWRFLFVRINLKDDYPDDNERFFYIEESKGADIVIMGNKNKFLSAFTNTLQKGEEKVYIITGSMNSKQIEKLISQDKKIIIFPDTINDELEILLKRNGIEKKGILKDVKSYDSDLYFKKVFVISGKKNMKIKNFPYNLFAISGNLCVASFYPSEENTNFVYYPEFVMLLYGVIKNFISEKISVPESSFYEVDLKEDSYSLYTDKGEKISDYEGGKIIMKPLSKGIYYLKNSEKIYLEVNSIPLPDIAQFEENPGNIIIIKNPEKLKSPDLKGLFLIFAIITFLIEVLLCVI